MNYHIISKTVKVEMKSNIGHDVVNVTVTKLRENYSSDYWIRCNPYINVIRHGFNNKMYGKGVRKNYTTIEDAIEIFEQECQDNGFYLWPFKD